jgi:tetratricopeptide (TPR) repeat protein
VSPTIRAVYRGITGLTLFLFGLPAVAQLEKAMELQRQGHAAEALQLFEQEIPLLRRTRDRERLAKALNAAGEACVSAGKYQAALQHSREALGIHRALKDRPAQARDWNALGLADLYLGNYAASSNEFQQAVALDRANGDREGEITRMNNLGNVYYFQGRYREALDLFSSALDKVNAAGNEKWSARRREITIANLATLYQRLGAEEKALELYSEFRQRPTAMRPAEAAQTLLNEGVLYRRLGDPIKALERYRSAQLLFAKDQHRDGEIGALRNIGIARGLDLEDLRGALDAFTAALDLAQQAGSNRGKVQAELYRGEILRRMRRSEDAQAALGRALVGAREAGLVEEQWKALYAQGMLAEERGDRTGAEVSFTEAIRQIETVRTGLQLSSLRTDFLADKRDVYDALVELLLGTDPAPIPRVFELIERSRARTFQDRIAALGTEAASLARVQAQLDPATLLIEYWIGSRSAAALWLRRDAAGVVTNHFTPGQTADLSEFADRLAQGASEWKPLSASLGRRLLGGLPLDGRVRHVMVVPDGVLQALPFEALEIPDSGSLLLEKYDVSYLPTAALVLNRRRSKREWRFPWQRQLVAIGDPVSGGTPVESDALSGLEQWQPLPRASEEVRTIARIVDGRAEQHLASDALKVHLSGALVESVPLLHFSTHAVADMRYPERSRILLAPAQRKAPFDYLFLREIYGMDLKGVDLVTVSACDTERGKVVRGEGAQGFSRAFLAAGARASVTSLWRVTDASAAEFMKQFYFAMSRGRSKADALRAAKLKFLRSGSRLAQPRYWAAFVLSGDGESPIAAVIPWSAMVAAAALAILGIGAVLVLRRQRRAASS